MSERVVIHVQNEEPFIADMEGMPPVNATYVQFSNPRTREGRQVPWATAGTTGYVFPMSRISFIEILVNSEEISGLEYFGRKQSRN